MHLGHRWAVAIAAAALGASAQAFTFATFADPSAGGGTPLFTLTLTTPTTGSLSGGWSGTGLTLQLPHDGLTYSNATFTMTPATGVVTAFTGVLGPGTINFFDSSHAAIFSIAFTSGELNPVSFGATTFLGLNGVVFSGPAVHEPLVGESFSFSFANQTQTSANTYTATAAFTSSAEAVPEPSGIAALCLGGIGLLSRRRRR